MLTTMATSALLHHDPSGNNADGSLLMGRPSPASSTGLYCDAYHQCKHLPEVSRDSGCDATMDGSDDDEELSVGSESPPPIPSDAPILDSGSGLESDLTSPSPAPSPDNQEVPISNNHRPENRIVEVVNHNNANNNGNNNNNNPPVRTLKFSIDNILKPEFGRPSSGGCRKSPTPVAAQRLTQPPAPARNSKPATAKQKNSECDGKKDEKSTASNGADADNQPIDLSKLPPSTYSGGNTNSSSSQPLLWPAWVYCTRYSDRPSSGPRSRRMKRKEKKPEEKRPRTAFTSEQLARLKQEFQENRYLTEKRRQALARDLKLNESQIKIWFQNKRAKIKKASGQKNPLALQLMAQGLYNHSTIPVRDDEEESTDKELKSTDK